MTTAMLVIANSPGREYRWLLRAGQRAKVGRSPWAEFCIEDDDQLQEFHCELASRFDEQPIVTAIENASIGMQQTWTPVAGDREQLLVTAGNTRLVLSRPRPLHAELPSVLVDEHARSLNGNRNRATVQPTVDLLREIGVSPRGLALLDTKLSVSGCVQLMIEDQLPEDALRFIAASLPVPLRLQWCSQQLQHAGHAPSAAVSGLVQLWLASPSEDLRQAIAPHVDWNRKHDPVTWLLASIGWTGGSLSAAGSIHVPPTDQMIITGVITAMQLAGAQSERDRFQSLAIERGLEWLQH